MNINDIARKAGVSAATVSRVINNTSPVNSKTKKRVMEIIEEEGYVPNVFARGLIMGSTKTIGILCPVIADLNHATQVSHLEYLLRQNGFDTLLVCTSSYDEPKKKYLDLLLAKRVDAVIIIGCAMAEVRQPDDILQAAGRVPVILLNGVIEGENIYCILADVRSATEECVNLLNRQGHDRILYLYDTDTYSGSEKRQGYRQGLAHCGIPEQNRQERQLPDDADDTIAAADQLLTELLTENQEACSAVITADDTLARGALKAFARKGISMPVIGFNNSRFATAALPEITSIDNMLELVCTTAISQLMDVFKEKTVPNRTVFSSKIIERESFVWTR